MKRKGIIMLAAALCTALFASAAMAVDVNDLPGLKSAIKAGGDTPSTFTGECGAESGWVPVTASSPMIFCTKIETQRREKSKDLPPILPAPDAK